MQKYPQATWKLIGTLIKHKPTGCTTPSNIVRNRADICEQFNQYFANVDQQLAMAPYRKQCNLHAIYKESPSFSFVMSPITEAQAL